MHASNPTLATVAVALLSALPTVSAGIYTKNSPVLQVDAKSYDRLVAKSNYTTVCLPISIVVVPFVSVMGLRLSYPITLHRGQLQQMHPPPVRLHDSTTH